MSFFFNFLLILNKNLFSNKCQRNNHYFDLTFDFRSTVANNGVFFLNNSFKNDWSKQAIYS